MLFPFKNHFRTKRQTALDTRLREFVQSTSARLDSVRDGGGLFNFRCFHNAAQYVGNHLHHEILEVLYWDHGGAPILHYIVRDTRTGVCIDNTLGYLAPTLTYYLLRVVPETEHGLMQEVFDRTQTVWSRRFTTWWDRHVLDIDRIL